MAVGSFGTYFAISADAPAEAMEGEVAGHPVFRLRPTIS